jgi:hypothetical protein
MQNWTEIRRRVLVEGASKRSIRRDYGVGAETIEKILANSEPPGYRTSAPRPKTRLGPFLGVISEILTADAEEPPKQQAYYIPQSVHPMGESVRNRPEVTRKQQVAALAVDRCGDRPSGRNRTGGSDLIEGWI